MASARISTRIRSAIGLALAAASIVLMVPEGAATAMPATPPAPTRASVTAQLDSLSHQNEVLAEKYNKAQIALTAAQRSADAAQTTADLASSQFQTAHAQLVSAAAQQYESGSFAGAGALMASGSKDGYLASLSTLDVMSKHRTGVLTQMTTAKSAAQSARKNADALLAQARAKSADLAKQRATVSAETDKFKTLLSSLTVVERRVYASSGSATPTQIAAVRSVHAGNAAAQRAVNYAFAQLGKRYVFAAAGPDAYDCSGLTMMAWRAGGVSLPHLASSQYDYGTHVSVSQIQPGDLVFMYHPIGHVSIYVGNGLLISASTQSKPILLVPLSHVMDRIVGVTRLA